MNPTSVIQPKALFKYSIALCFWLFLSSLYAASNQKLSIQFTNTPPLKAFATIEATSPYRFVYQKQLDLSKPLISMTRENVEIDDVLEAISNQTGLVFQRSGTNIAVKQGQKNVQQGIGVLSGKLVDEIGAPLPGATIQTFPGNDYAIADNNGHFSIELPAGMYTVEISMMGFQTYRIAEVNIENDTTTPLNIALVPAAEALDEVVLTATYNPEVSSVEGLLVQQKKAAQFSDGISAEQIAKTPDNDVGATLKRITGVTTVDDKYVVVRSLGDRWNQAVMDGINLPSTDAYQQHFAFDIIPNALVESVVVSKTATPDMASNFAGGMVEIRTKDIPLENFTSISIQNSYNDRSTFKDRVTKQQGKYDYFGFDDGTRDFPSLEFIDLPVTEASAGPYIAQSRKFTRDNFTNYTEKNDPGAVYQLALGRTYKLKDNKWGFVGAVTFRNTQTTQEIAHTERGKYMRNTLFSPVNEENGQYYNRLEQYGFKNTGASYNYNATLAGMLNGGIQLDNHRLSLRNTYTHIYDNELTQIDGWNYYNDAIDGILDRTQLPRRETVNYPVYQTFIQNKLEGNHHWNKLDMDWFLAHTHTSKDTKDATFTEAFRTLLGEDELLQYQVYNSANNIKRENYWNTETDFNWGGSLSWKFNLGHTRHIVKTGYSGSIRKAENQQTRASLRRLAAPSEGDLINISTPFSELLDGSYYRWNGFGWSTFNFYGEKYEGKVEMHSPFLMFDNRFTNWLRLVWGLRAENYVYTQLESQRQDETYITEQLDDKKWQYLPSVGLIISPNSNTNIRLGYNKSVIRPQFSERLQVPYYDPVRSALVLANWSGIFSSVVENYDLKFEWFPALGEIISAGLYHKSIQDPIEAVTRIAEDGGSRYIHTVNSKNAKLWGVELEIRKSLSFLGEGKALDNLFLSGNATFNDTKVVSIVNLDGSGGTYEADRPLYGQSPYAYNLGMDYTGERFGASVRHNASGDQYILVGYTYDAEEIRMPYATTDAQLSWRFLPGKNLGLKLNIKNIFDAVYQTYNNANSYQGKEREEYQYGDNPRERYTLTPGASDTYDEGIDQKMFKSHIGRTFGLSINYNF